MAYTKELNSFNYNMCRLYMSTVRHKVRVEAARKENLLPVSIAMKPASLKLPYKL